MSTPVKIHRQQKQTAGLIGKKGKIITWTLIRVAGKYFSHQAPFPVVILELDNGEKLIGQLVDWREEDLISKREVIAVLRRSGVDDHENVINYTIKFKPL